MLVLYVEKYQNFAKQLTITSLLIFASISVQLKMPRESISPNGNENLVIDQVKKIFWFN